MALYIHCASFELIDLDLFEAPYHVRVAKSILNLNHRAGLRPPHPLKHAITEFMLFGVCEAGARLKIQIIYTKSRDQSRYRDAIKSLNLSFFYS